MKADYYYFLIKAGLKQEEIVKIFGCEEREMQVRMLRKCRCNLLEEIHEKQQFLDAIDYMIRKIKEEGYETNTIGTSCIFPDFFAKCLRQQSRTITRKQ